MITSVIGDPVLELAEMERIMMTLFPYNMLLNPRVGQDQLAERIAEVFGLDYSPEKPRSGLINFDTESFSQRERKERSNIYTVSHFALNQ